VFVGEGSRTSRSPQPTPGKAKGKATLPKAKKTEGTKTKPVKTTPKEAKATRTRTKKANATEPKAKKTKVTKAKTTSGRISTTAPDGSGLWRAERLWRGSTFWFHCFRFPDPYSCRLRLLDRFDFPRLRGALGFSNARFCSFWYVGSITAASCAPTLPLRRWRRSGVRNPTDAPLVELTSSPQGLDVGPGTPWRGLSFRGDGKNI
jgi:hypothetical protein